LTPVQRRPIPPAANLLRKVCFLTSWQNHPLFDPPPEPSSIPRHAFVDPALALHEFLQRLGIRLVLGGVPHQSRPLAPSPLVGLGRVRGAPNNGSKRVFSIRHFQPLQAQRPPGSIDFTAVRCPPSNEAVYGAQVAIDRVPVSAGLDLLPDVSEPVEVLAQCRRRIRDDLFRRESWMRCSS
jgi:hypothetical protein